MNLPISDEARALLTEPERERLSFFKWAYVLQADGFTRAQAVRLVFCRWLYLKGRMCE